MVIQGARGRSSHTSIGGSHRVFEIGCDDLELKGWPQRGDMHFKMRINIGNMVFCLHVLLRKFGILNDEAPIPLKCKWKFRKLPFRS